MSYYNDARDILEEAYPTCTTFVRYHHHPTLNEISRLARDIVMVMSMDSKMALERFKHLCYGVEDTNARVHVYDFNGIEEVLSLLASQGEVRGEGEIFWIEQGRTVAAMIKDFDAVRFGELTDKLYRSGETTRSSTARRKS